VEPAAVAALAGSAVIVAGAALTLAAGGQRASLFALGLALLAVPLAVVSPLDALASAFWVIAVLTAWVLLLGGTQRPEAVEGWARVALPLGGWPEAGFVLLSAALTFAAVSPPLGPVRAATAAGAMAAIAAAALLLFVPGVRRATSGAILSVLAAPLAVATAGVVLDQAFVVALGLAVLGVAAANRALLAAGSGDPSGRPNPDAP
jgi:hypothetical protein